MISNILKTKNIINPTVLFLLFLFPFLVSCSSKQNNIIEVITPPIIPNEFSNIPDQTLKPELLTLISVDEKVSEIKSGRTNPFLPPQFNDELQIPFSFKYYGQIATGNTMNAFVSYEDRNGTVKKGDIGGDNTDLLPLGWTVISMDPHTNVLMLGYQDRSLAIRLFSEK